MRYVIFGSEVYRDGVDPTPREFYDKLARRRGLRRLAELMATQGAFRELCVAHADAADAAQEVVERLSSVHPRERLLICQAGAAVTTHLGLGAVGICGVLEE